MSFTPIRLTEMLMSKTYSNHRSHLMLLDKDGPNLSCHHGDNCGDVIFEAVREAAPPGDTVLLKMRHMLSHAFHLLESTMQQNQCSYCESDECAFK